ncbi:Nop domain-containing protein [Tothia fuscella]|uniref:Nucleolar protein 58 n=1 Tax=Tothia fuscella TaxID=1048955 RepID=A0A9P4NM85_9PEZI|nr:Nop domain-containing protein [Tothia fuscella]
MPPLFILAETSAGYSLFKSTDKKLLKRTDFAEQTQTAEGACSLLRLKKFQKFDNANVALNESVAIGEGKVTPMLAALLDELKDERKASLAVADPKLANAINKIPGLSLQPISDDTTKDLYRTIREHIVSLIPGLSSSDINSTSLGLSHSLSRHKLKFSPDKVDTMIIQAIALLDDLDKELNTYAMRVKEWYGWHFPEMARIINDNVAYARVVLHVGMRSKTSSSDLSEILPEEIEAAIKHASEVSMGTEITDEDLINIQALAEQVVGFTEYRSQLSSYLTNRMQAIAPNLTTLVGELVGARLIAHAGSLTNLAKSPASTIQILGAEKALFRALKTKHDTPKYGLIYHASLIGQASGKNKGKIARVLAAKAALGLRVDSLATWGADQEHSDDEEPTEEVRSALGIAARRHVESRLRHLEGKPIKFDRGGGVGPPAGVGQVGKWEIKEARKYNADADALAGDEPAAAVQAALPAVSKSKKEKKEKKPLIEEVNGDATLGAEESDDDDSDASDDDVEMTNGAAHAPATNGSAKKDKGKDAERAAKAARKAEREEKRRRKEEKRAKKDGKKEGKKDKGDKGEKRKRSGEDDSVLAGEKKKKKKSKA